jgi:hypothetical protein
MKLRLVLAVVCIALVGGVASATTKSDYDRNFDFSKLKTWDFKAQNRMPRDPIGANSLWDRRLRENILQQLAAHGYGCIDDGEPTFLVAYYMSVKERYDIRYIDYGFPGIWARRGRGYRPAWAGWEPGWRGQIDVWKIPYNESTVVMDIIDTKSNNMVWRGYDVDTIDLNKSDKSIREAVEDLVDRLVKDIRKSQKRVR